MSDLSLIERLRAEAAHARSIGNLSYATYIGEAASALESQQERLTILQTTISNLHDHCTSQQERIAELLRARDEGIALITAERERMDALVGKQQERIAELETKVEEVVPQLAMRRDINKQQAATIAALTETLETRVRQIKAMAAWLDENQHDVWRRGLWDALNAALAKAEGEGK